MKKVTC